MQPIYLSKQLAAASSNGIGSISTAATPVVTVNSSILDTGRRIVWTTTATSTSLGVTITGRLESNNVLAGALVSETIYGTTASSLPATTTWDFMQVVSIAYTSAPGTPILVGTSSVGGTPWKLASQFPFQTAYISGEITFTSTALGMTGGFDVTLDDPTNTYVRLDGPPTVYDSTSPIGGATAASTNSWGLVNADGNLAIPITAWRMTITSSGPTNGIVYGTIVQSGV